jgi:hypothetical protein
MTINNNGMASYSFLKEMYRDPYFPDELVKKGESILVSLCIEIERTSPSNLSELYALTHAATDRFNDLQEEFYSHDSEIETAAREAISEDFVNIAKSYGFPDADREELVATRDW